ncbi:LANO_0C02102g1_1 [Lachancea nothofagi CBS 11611]|uniref:LANO_0C02102g1_1 n=1 Tax=Lachancea nothofagi CBS 11611 TaxID=1266666 RepID=A0A1G4J4I3_9SACH|nr:LANO_0C02102g1_1 [Lachancea nothofagi CBS 11611]
MAPSLAMVQVIPGVVLPIRIFINRKQVAKNIKESRTSFETPVLSNNSIIRLKSPLVRLYLSNTDAKNLCEDIRNELMLVLYELTAKNVNDEIVSKVKIGNLVEFKDVLERIPAIKSMFGAQTELCHLLTLERTGKYQYKLHYDHKWGLDIFITDIRKLVRIRNSLLMRLSPKANAIPGVPMVRFSGMKILRRIREEVPTTLTIDDEQGILKESDEELDVSQVDLGEHSSLTASNLEPNKQDKKPQFKYVHQPMLNLGNCIDIHVLKRPRRGKANS